MVDTRTNMSSSGTEISIAEQTVLEDGVEHDTRPREDKKLAADFQSDITDADVLKLAFFQKFAGWVEVSKSHSNIILGIKETSIDHYFSVRKKTRYMNEDCASMLFNDIMPLVSRMTVTGKLDSMTIYNLWHSKIMSIIFALHDNYYQEYNTYKINVQRMNDIVAYLCAFSAITQKASDGFTLKEIAESFVTTSVFSNRGQEQVQKSEGILQRIAGAVMNK